MGGGALDYNQLPALLASGVEAEGGGTEPHEEAATPAATAEAEAFDAAQAAEVAAAQAAEAAEAAAQATADAPSDELFGAGLQDLLTACETESLVEDEEEEAAQGEETGATPADGAAAAADAATAAAARGWAEEARKLAGLRQLTRVDFDGVATRWAPESLAPELEGGLFAYMGRRRIAVSPATPAQPKRRGLYDDDQFRLIGQQSGLHGECSHAALLVPILPPSPPPTSPTPPPSSPPGQVPPYAPSP